MREIEIIGMGGDSSERGGSTAGWDNRDFRDERDRDNRDGRDSRERWEHCWLG